MKSMKKFSILFMAIAFLCVGVLFSACTSKGEASITFNQNNATIYLGETDNNQVSILATLKNVEVNKLDLVYDTSFVTISQEKNSDGTFTITVKSLIDYGTKPIAVEVKASNKASAVFYVDIVLPLQNIVAKDNLYIAYNGEKTSYSLIDFISFEPEGTVQKGVEFSVQEESEQYHIENNKLVVEAGVDVAQLSQIKVNATSTVVIEGKQPVSAELNIKLIPNIKLLSDNISVSVDYNGDKLPLQNKSYELTIKKESNGYKLSTFEIEVVIPQSLGIEVDLDSSSFGGLSTNILNYLSYSRRHTLDTTNASNIKDVYTFTFETKSSLQGKGDLRMKYWYKDYSDDNNLSANFIAKVENEIVEKLSLTATMPITSIDIRTDCVFNADTNIYTIYNNYKGVYGEAFTFVALPEGTSQRTIVLEKAEDSELQVYNSKGNLLPFVRYIYDENGTLIETKNNQQEITSGETIYIKGANKSIESLTYFSSISDKESATRGTLSFNVANGTSALGFVDDTESTDLKEEIVLNAEINNSTVTYLLAPNAKVSDFIKDDNVIIEPVLGKDNYFKVTFSALKIGKQIYIIKTINGYKVTANLNVIQPLENVVLKLKDNSQYLAGIGDYAPKNSNSDLINISIEKGYSIALDYVINQNAQISKIKYSFYNPQNIDVYGDEINRLKDVYNYNYPTLFDELSLVLNNQNLVQNNILTGVNSGINVIKIEIYGQKVLNGQLIDEIKNTKFLFAQIYNPVKQINSTAKNITLRTADQVASEYESLTTKTLTLNVTSEGGEKATYNKIFIDGSAYDITPTENGGSELVCSKIINKDGIDAIEVIYNFTTGKLSIKANKYVKFTEQPQIILFAGDFVDFENGRHFYTDSTDRPIITYIISINLIETKVIEDISVSNLELDTSKSDSTTKVYKTIYIDTSKAESITYKLSTEITPFDAFDKALKYTFIANSGSTQAMIDIDDNGLITILGEQGGSGVITIEPKNNREGMTVKTVKIPIVVSDGNSWETAYEITSLDQIKYANKHYVLTIPTTYTLTETLFDSLEGGFRGGLYGRRFNDTESSKATIKLQGVSLFNILASTAVVADLDICGDVSATEFKNSQGTIEKFTSRGFVANINAGKIENVKVTSYLLNGIYVPSLLTIGADVTKVGGIAGENKGIIENCTFAGSINVRNNSTIVANAIANNTTGTLSNNKVITAKYDSAIESLRLVNDGVYYVNGVVGGTNITFADIDNDKVVEENYKDYEFSGNIWIANYQDETSSNLNNSYGEEDSTYGLVFYYLAKDSTKQSNLELLNLIPYTKLFGLKNTSITTNNLKVLALNFDNTLCDFISINSQGIALNGVGQFILSVSSEYDYTTTYNLSVLSIYHATDFTLSSNGVMLNKNSSELEIIYGEKYEVISKMNNLISIINTKGQRETIELVQNDFDVLFTMAYEGMAEEINSENYITGTKLGSHTINMTFEWYDKTNIKVSLASGFGAHFDALLNRFFNITDGEVGEFNVRRKNGTTDITTDVKEGSIEPKDTFTFSATLTTDVSTDIIDENTIEIYTENNISITEQQYFDIFVEKDSTKDNTFKIQISVNQDNIRNAGYNLLDFVSRKYTIIVKAKNSTGIDEKIYSASQDVYVTLLPQTVSNINTVLYGVTSSNTTGVNVSNKETPTSVLIPSGNGGLFVIDMFPAYASYDYIDVVATSNTISKLSFRLQERIEDATGELTNNYRNTNKGYEPLIGKNGIRLLNNNSKDNQNIGTYYLKVFADASFSGDTIFTITVNAYYKDNKLSASSVFTLFMKMPEAPQISLNGESKIYTLAGQTIENIEVLVSSEQINPTAQIASNLSGESLIDGKSTNAIHCNMREVATNNLVGYKKYLITVTFDDDYVANLNVNSTQFKIVVTSIKISNGSEIPVTAEMYIYVVDYKTLKNDIRIFNASENVFNVTSLKYLELRLADLLPENVKATQEFITFFNENYYYSNSNTEFTFGSNKMLVNGEEKELTKAQVLASYLSYVKGNVKTPVLKIGQNNEFELVSTEYLSFDIQDGKLLVRGGNYTGSTSMILEIEYKMPDGKVFTYEYNFEIVNSLYTTEDLPKEIANVDSFLDIENQDNAYDYILTTDLYLYDYNPISSTSKINSLDGNNHTIHIINFAEGNNVSDFALFKTISSSTTIKNLTVNIYHLRQIVVSSKVTTANIAGFAIQNDGAIYNCEVVAFDNESLPAMSSSYGIKVDKDVNAQVAGFVLTNNGSITNSRFGGTTKLVTKVVYTTNEDGKVVNSKVSEQTYAQKMLTIQASGTISGFVGTNNGVIASSFVKNVDIQNTYYKLETKVTAGFVNTNNGKIAMSYAEGGFENNTDIRALKGGLEGLGIMTGFVYLNAGEITDSYSNLSITNTKEQVGRLGAGFVFENTESGAVERCYSASKVLSNNITQMNFAGIKDFGGYNNQGTIKTSYYYIENSTDEISIENILGTTINSIINVSDKKEFYGFSFEDGNKAGTWNINDNGRLELVSANDIAHSVRAKNENTTGANTGIEYYFTYCSGYELGSNSNPIIIRDAKEFNAVFGNSVSTDIQDCYNLSTAKVYGSYRLVNDINMLDLVPKEEQETEYKVSLVSTKMTLSGEYNYSSNKGGSINGNGLTITNLAISNSSSVSNNYGLFKSIENGASISNLNIELAKSGVSADHTVFVGTIAGSLVDSYANNIYIKGTSSTEYTKIVGANVTGGAFGRVIGDSKVSNISIENISVTSTYFENYVFDSSNIDKTNIYTRLDEGSYSTLSIAGGAFGVVDLYTITQQDNSAVVSAVDSQQAGLSNISATGGIYIEGMTAGGIAGFVGNYVIARDLSLTINKEGVKSGIIAYNCYAGGIVGFNRGYLYQVKAEQEHEWQTEIESNMQAYYNATAEDRESIDRGSLDLFESDLYTPYAVGGLVGVQQSGKISIAYSKLNVINTKAKVVGGAVGYICDAFKPTGVKEEDIVSFTMHETYATGDVYTESTRANIGGVIGKNYDEGIKLTKVNALNYWGINSFNIFKNGLNSITISAIANYASAGIDADASTHVYSISGIKFGNAEEEKVTFVNDSDIEVMCSYYDYDGVLSDNGAQIDLMFSKKEWYLENNWTRDLTELFPHIVYISPRNQYTISSVNDFYKFTLYGNDPNVAFVVIDYDMADPSKGDDDLLIPCDSVQVTYGLLRAKIVGATAKNGFRNLNIPLFSEMNGNEASTLKFLDCTAPLTQRANNEQFNYLTYSNCNFTVKTNRNIGGIAQEVINTCEFKNITFTNCTVNASNATNAGMLFGSHNQNTLGNKTAIKIGNVTIAEDSVRNVISGTTTVSNSVSEYNYGILFGKAGEVEISNIKIFDKMSINLNSPNEVQGVSDEASIATNIGLLAGSVSYLNINLEQTTLTAGSAGQLSVNCKNGDTISEFDKISLNLNVGGIVGNCSNQLVLSVTKKAEGEDVGTYVNVSYAPTIKIENTQNVNSQYVGTVCGIANKISAEENGIYIIGKTEAENGKIVYKALEYSLAEKTTKNAKPINNIGGIAGKANLITSTESEGVIQANPGIIAYYGDMKSSMPESTDINYLNIGGIVGILTATSQNVISNVIFDGTISFADEYFDKNNTKALENLYLRAGGVIGYVSDNGTLIKNTIASGEIILTDRIGNSLKITDDMKGIHIAGLVGLNDGVTDLGTEGTDGEGVSVITTIFSLTGANGVDSIAHNSGNGYFNLYNKVKYSSSLNLVVSSLQKGNSIENHNDYLEVNKPDSVEEFLINTEYGQLNESNMSVWNVANNTVKGSKLDPYYIDEENNIPEKGEYDTVENNEYFFTKAKSGKNGAETGADILTYTSTYIRKLYIGVKGDKQLPNQISLKNTILFSQGASLLSTITPINEIDSNSAVTGLVVKLYINESEGSEATNVNDYYNLAGLANVNKGIIYTCSVQESLTGFKEYDNSTRFYGYFYSELDYEKLKYAPAFTNAKLPKGIAGFVANNKGYIFGSNANVEIKTDQAVVASSFVVANEGVISYCYATGVNNCNEGYVFVAKVDNTITNEERTSGKKDESVIEHSYSIVKAVNPNVSTYVPTGVYVESDASELKFTSNDITLYKATEQKDKDDNNTNKLIKEDENGYYDCDPYYNYNYPTLTGGLFKEFTFLKRSTMVEEDKDTGMYKERDIRITFSKTEYSNAGGYNYSGYGYNYYVDELYCQIPNLTVLKDLNAEGTDVKGLTNDYSKFVIIGDINVGYKIGEKENEYIDKTVGASTLGTIATTTQLYGLQGDKVVEIDKYADVVIDGQNKTLKNLVYRNNIKLIDEITNIINGSPTGSKVTIKNIQFDRVSIGGNTVGLINHVSNGVTLDNITFVNNSANDNGEQTNNAGVLIRTAGYTTGKNDESYGLVYSTDIEKQVTQNIIGVLVGTNEGTIQNCSFLSSITTDGKAIGSYALGGFVGYNKGTGKVNNCSFAGNVYISENFTSSTKQNLDLQVVFGGIVAVNGTTNNEIALSENIVESGAINNYLLTYDGSVYRMEYLSDAQVDSLLLDDSNKEKYQLNAQIYVKTSNKAVVGGIVGLLESGIVNRSSTCKSTEDKEYTIMVGDEYSQRVAYAGGIAGIVKSEGNVQDCSNRSNISTMAIWLFTTNKADMANYSFNINNLAERTGAKSNVLGDRVLYTGNDSEFEISTKLDNEEGFKQYAKLYIYKDMVSLAYSGGIAGYGISAVETDSSTNSGNARLANYGTISGGFRAKRPVAVVYNGSYDANKIGRLNAGFYASALATYITAAFVPYAMGLFSNVFTAIGGIAILSAWVGSNIGYVSVFEEIYESVTCLDLYVDGFVGCSTRYHRDNNFVLNLFADSKDSKKWDDSAIKKINKALSVEELNDDQLTKLKDYFKGPSLPKGIIDSVKETSDYTNIGDFIFKSDTIWSMYLAIMLNNRVIVASSPVVKLASKLTDLLNAIGLKGFKDMYEKAEMVGLISPYNENGYPGVSSKDLIISDNPQDSHIHSVSMIEDRVSHYTYTDEKTKITDEKYMASLNSYSYDGICPSLIGTVNKNLTVYSKTSNFNETEENNDILTTLNTTNADNRLIKFKIADCEGDVKKYTFIDNYCKDNNIGVNESSIDSWNTEAHPWVTSRDNCKIPQIESESTIDKGSGPNSIIEKEDGSYEYTLTNAKNWARIVNTINDANKGVLDRSDAEKYLNMTIIVNLNAGQSEIPVGKNTFDKFNGTIIFRNPGYRFTNLVLSDKQGDDENNGVGLIKQTNGVKLIGVSVKGTVSFSISDKDETSLNAGILIGEVIPKLDTDMLEISSSRIVPSKITLTETSLTRITNFGGVVGSLKVGKIQTQEDSEEQDEEKIYQSKLNNITIGSSVATESQFIINVQKLNIKENANKNLGGVVGYVNSDELDADTLILNKISTLGKISLISEFNNVGGIVGRIDSTNAQLGEIKENDDSVDTSTIQLSIGIASYSNTFVGGIVGYNGGALIDVVTPLNIGTNTGITISADVINETKSAYAGGLIGNNEGNVKNNDNIQMGNEILTSFSSISYVFAGYNGMNLESRIAIPKMSNASIFVGAGNSIYNVSSYSFIAKYMYNDFTKFTENTSQSSSPNWDDIDKTFSMESEEIVLGDNKDYILYETKEENGFNYLISNDISKAVETDYAKYSYSYTATGEETPKPITLEKNKNGNIAINSNKRIGYKITPLTYNNFVSSNAGDVNHKEWKLEISYIENTTNYTIKTNNIDVKYEYIISLIGSNARVEDTGRYTLIIKQTNGYNVESEQIGTVNIKATQTIEVPGIDLGDVDTQTPIYKTKYVKNEEISVSKPVVLVSKTFKIDSLNTEKTEIIRLDEIFKYSLSKSISTLSKSEDKYSFMKKSEEYSASLKNLSLGFNIDYNASTKKFSLNIEDKYKLTITANVSSTESTVDENNPKTDKDGNIIPDTKDNVYKKSKETIYTRTIVLTNDISTGDLTSNNKVDLGEFNNSYSIYINRKNKSEEPLKSGEYSVPITINESISLGYSKPIFKYQGDTTQYDELKVFKYTNEDKNLSYLIVSCMQRQGEYDMYMKEFVYAIKKDNSLEYYGNISYKLTGANGKLVDEIYKQFFEDTIPARHESYFPSFIDGGVSYDNSAYDFKNGILKNPTSGEIKFICYTSRNTVEITSNKNDMTYSYRVITDKMQQVITVKPNGDSYDIVKEDKTIVANETTIGNETIIRFAENSGLGGLLTAEKKVLSDCTKGTGTIPDDVDTDSIQGTVVEYWTWETSNNKNEVVAIHTQYQELQKVEKKDEEGNLVYDEEGNVVTEEVYVTIDKYYQVIDNRIRTVFDSPDEIFFYVSTGTYNLAKFIVKESA